MMVTVRLWPRQAFGAGNVRLALPQPQGAQSTEGFVAYRVEGLEARAKPAVPGGLRSSPTEACCSPLRPSECQSSQAIASPGVRPYRVEEGGVIKFFYRGWKDIPAKSVIQTQLGSQLPGIANMKVPRPGARVFSGYSLKTHASLINLLKQEAGYRVPAVQACQTRFCACEVECS